MMEGASRRGFVRQTKPDHTLGTSIAISILSGGWALGGFIDLEEGRDEYGSGRLAESPSLCKVRALGSRWLLACPGHAICSHDWTTDGVAGAEDGYILGRHTRPSGPTWLSAGLSLVSCHRKSRPLRYGWLTAGPGAKTCSSSGRVCSQAIAVVGFPPALLKMPPLRPFLVYAFFLAPGQRSKSSVTHSSTEALTRVSRVETQPARIWQKKPNSGMRYNVVS
jgi:hypothetical protein